MIKIYNVKLMRSKAIIGIRGHRLLIGSDINNCISVKATDRLSKSITMNNSILERYILKKGAKKHIGIFCLNNYISIVKRVLL